MDIASISCYTYLRRVFGEQTRGFGLLGLTLRGHGLSIMPNDLHVVINHVVRPDIGLFSAEPCNWHDLLEQSLEPYSLQGGAPRYIIVSIGPSIAIINGT